MPWSPKQMKALRARAHGWHPSAGGPFANVSEEKAAEMSKEGVKGGGSTMQQRAMSKKRKKPRKGGGGSY